MNFVLTAAFHRALFARPASLSIVRCIVTNKMSDSNGKIDSLLQSVKEKFDTAKAIFTEKQLAGLEAENSALRGEIDRLRIQLGGEPSAENNAPPLQHNKTAEAPNAVNIDSAEPFPTAAPIAAKKKEGKQPKEGNKSGNKGAEDAAAVVDVGRLDLRVGRIVEAKKHPDADALYVESIDLGEESGPRTVVSGLVRFVPVEQLQDRLVICLCNLKPAKMRGVESQAMVMCASTAEKVEVLEIVESDGKCKPGDPVLCPPYGHRPDAQLNPKKKVWEQVAPDLQVDHEGKAVYKGAKLLVNGKLEVAAPTLRDVPVK